ncbi:MAG: hypothetical protein LBS60_01590 [Deltaproteobacteria bacterium]|jgi:hypothetical protein|nr:hypothetical protein [Deltaproteobacteria bacterium]
MGEIFYATIYDIEDMTCFSTCVEKFHANCYSFSGAVVYAHYLLRQKPFRVMWFGQSVLSEYDGLNDFSETSDLLGISAYVQNDDFLLDNVETPNEDSRAKLQFIRENSQRWRSINIINKEIEYFNFENFNYENLNYDKKRSVLYSGFLLNHTKKLAINLTDYLQRSSSMFGPKGDIFGAIDLIPVLTETGGGADMAFLDGISWDTTEDLAEQWRGDSLQIVDEPPTDYQIIKCCFANIWGRAIACRSLYGVDSFNYILGDKNGNRYECAKLSHIYYERGPRRQVRVKIADNIITFTAEVAPNGDGA